MSPNTSLTSIKYSTGDQAPIVCKIIFFIIINPKISNVDRHNLFLHSALVLSRKIPKSERGINVRKFKIIMHINKILKNAKIKNGKEYDQSNENNKYLAYIVIDFACFVHQFAGCMSILSHRKWICIVCGLFNQCCNCICVRSCLLGRKPFTRNN